MSRSVEVVVAVMSQYGMKSPTQGETEMAAQPRIICHVCVAATTFRKPLSLERGPRPIYPFIARSTPILLLAR